MTSRKSLFAVSHYRKGVGLRVRRFFCDLSWGWRWKLLVRRDEGLKLCIFGVLLELGRFPK